MRDLDILISGLLLVKATFFGNELEILDLKQSIGWLDRYKERHGIKKLWVKLKSVDVNSTDMNE